MRKLPCFTGRLLIEQQSCQTTDGRRSSKRRAYNLGFLADKDLSRKPLGGLPIVGTDVRKKKPRALLMGRAKSVAKIAERERVSDRYVRRLTRLAFLAPQIVEAIVAGNQPPELTAEALAERIDLPLPWTAQEKAVGIAS